MSYSLLASARFGKDLKRLAKKYPSIKADVLTLANDLLVNPLPGTPLGNNCYKIRLAISSKQKGKSGGARIITNILVEGELIRLLTIYDKSEQDTVSQQTVEALTKEITRENK